MRPSGPSETEAAKWDAMYKELEAYHREHGHSNVPSTLKNKLSRWVGKQRQHRRQMEAYPVKRIARLDRLRFYWGTSTQRQSATTNTPEQDARWREMYEKLKTYKAENGHCKVPVHANAGDPELGPLGSWVSNQRSARARMAQSRKDLLDAIGFHWYADNWDTMYEQLVKFRKEHGHTNVPTRYAANRTLGEWCRKQRGYMRQNKVPPDRRRRLEDIEFDFEPQSEKNERIWHEKFQRLKEYKREHGDCLVPTKSSTKGADDEELSVWVTRQRMSYRCGKLPNHRMQKLEEVGFVWSIVERGPQSESKRQALQWERSYEELREFYEKEGHFVVPAALENGKINPLSAWVSQQRKVYALGEIKKERRLKLDAINFVWREAHAHESQRRFDRAFNSLNEFKLKKGHTFVRKSDDIVLWRWARKMNWMRKRGTLSPEREERLDSIGFWDPPPPGYRERGEDDGGSEIEDFVESDDNDDERKPAPKRRKISSSSSESAEEKEEVEQRSTGLSSRYTLGTRVKKFFKDYGWFSGEIVSVDDDCWHIRYEDGDEENYLVEELDDLDTIVANARTA